MKHIKSVVDSRPKRLYIKREKVRTNELVIWLKETKKVNIRAVCRRK